MSNGFLDELFSLKGQIAVVIGGTGVLCGALAEGLAKAGATVVVAGRGEEAGAKRVASIEAAGGKACFMTVDVKSRESITALKDAVVAKFGRVDILINGAGVNSASPYFDAKDEDWNHVLACNLTAVQIGCQVFGKQMADQGGGSILNIGSVSSDKPLSRVYAYSASKAAVVNLTQNVARELAPLKVRVNALCPGFFPAEQNRKILDADRVAKIFAQTPMNRFGEPDELVGCAILLLSRAAGSFITGAAYYVDGGFTGMRL
jgi:NAD(P)-dependent dehydrogenase (short-subunit alcohol dehydrogenase family)